MNERPNLRRINLRNDASFLFHLMVESGYLRDCLFSSIDEFIGFLSARLNSDYHDFFVIVDTDSKSSCGVIFSHNFQLIDQRSNITILTNQGTSNSISQAAILQFENYLFYSYPLRKLFCETNKDTIAIWEECGYRHEARLNDYRFEKGQYRDIYILGKNRAVL